MSEERIAELELELANANEHIKELEFELSEVREELSDAKTEVELTDAMWKDACKERDEMQSAIQSLYEKHG